MMSCKMDVCRVVPKGETEVDVKKLYQEKCIVCQKLALLEFLKYGFIRDCCSALKCFFGTPDRGTIISCVVHAVVQSNVAEARGVHNGGGGELMIVGHEGYKLTQP